jgi:hypothetical protein
MVSAEDKITMERIRVEQMTLANAVADVFTAAVGVAQSRYVFAILISNDEPDTQQFTILHRDTADADTAFLDSVRLDGAGTLLIGSFDYTKPILVLSSDEQLRASMDTVGKSAEMSVWYWDEDLN